MVGKFLTITFLRRIPMTIQELIDKVQEEKPNTFDNEKLVSFVNEVEWAVAEELRKNFVPYTENDFTEDLLAPAPYDRLYVSYLKAMIDYSNEEYASYQLNEEQYNIDFTEFENFVVRTGLDHDNLFFPHRFRGIW